MSDIGVQRKAKVTQGWGSLWCLKGKRILGKEGKSEYGILNPTLGKSTLQKFCNYDITRALRTEQGQERNSQQALGLVQNIDNTFTSEDI